MGPQPDLGDTGGPGGLGHDRFGAVLVVDDIDADPGSDGQEGERIGLADPALPLCRRAETRFRPLPRPGRF
jgi:hypothetical protein